MAEALERIAEALEADRENREAEPVCEHPRRDALGGFGAGGGGYRCVECGVIVLPVGDKA